MEPLDNAQRTLKKYDRRHWVHDPGPATLRHTFLHLIASATEAIPRNPDATFPESIPEWTERATRRFSGILLEHAIRIANASGMRLANVLADGGERATPERIGAWLHTSWQLIRLPTRRSSQELFLDFTAGLNELARLIERIDHGPENWYKLPLKPAVQYLSRFSAMFGPISGDNINADQLLNPERIAFNLGLFCQPFHDRLVELRGRLYMPALTE